MEPGLHLKKNTLLTVITGTQHSPGFIDHNVERITLMCMSNLLIHFLYCVITKHEPTRLVLTGITAGEETSAFLPQCHTAQCNFDTKRQPSETTSSRRV